MFNGRVGNKGPQAPPIWNKKNNHNVDKIMYFREFGVGVAYNTKNDSLNGGG